MTATTGAPRSRGASGRSKANGKGKHITPSHKLLKGLELAAPPELPATYSWDIAELQALAADDDIRLMGVMFKLVATVVGEGQMQLIRRTLSQQPSIKGAQGLDVLSSLIVDIENAYALEPGEADASPAP